MRYSIVPNETKTAIVKAVHDGDSIKVQFKDGEVRWIRLYGCDAPEVISNHVAATQPFGRESGNELRKVVKGQAVEVKTLFKDQFNRMICNVSLIVTDLGKDDEKIDLTELLISRGLAWWLDEPRMTPEIRTKLKDLHETAQKNKWGLWGQEGRKLRPSTWRSRNRRFLLEKEFEDLW
jgi:endonuclease YncB( thermonuclease family)